jgi:hypothetical protein
MGEILADGKPHGLGMAMYADQCVYIGDWRGGKRTGFGILESGCNVFEGQYEEDVRTGHGIKTSRKNRKGVMQGRWARGVLQGVTEADMALALSAQSKARQQAVKIKKMLGVGDDVDVLPQQCKEGVNTAKKTVGTETKLLQIVGCPNIVRSAGPCVKPCRPTKLRTRPAYERVKNTRHVGSRRTISERSQGMYGRHHSIEREQDGHRRSAGLKKTANTSAGHKDIVVYNQDGVSGELTISFSPGTTGTSVQIPNMTRISATQLPPTKVVHRKAPTHPP